MSSSNIAHLPAKRPRVVTVIACLFIAAGTVGLVYHGMEVVSDGIFGYDALWILLLRGLAIVAGVLMLRGANVARWLALAWLGYHVVLSAFHAFTEAAIHGLLMACIAYALFHPLSTAYFRRDTASQLPG